MKISFEKKLRYTFVVFFVTLGILTLGNFVFMKDSWTLNGLGLFALLSLLVSIVVFGAFHYGSKIVLGLIGLGYISSHVVYLIQAWNRVSLNLILFVWSLIWIVFIVIAVLFSQNRSARRKLKDLKGS